MYGSPMTQADIIKQTCCAVCGSTEDPFGLLSGCTYPQDVAGSLVCRVCFQELQRAIELRGIDMAAEEAARIIRQRRRASSVTVTVPKQDVVTTRKIMTEVTVRGMPFSIPDLTIPPIPGMPPVFQKKVADQSGNGRDLEPNGKTPDYANCAECKATALLRPWATGELLCAYCWHRSEGDTHAMQESADEPLDQRIAAVDPDPITAWEAGETPGFEWP